MIFRDIPQEILDKRIEKRGDDAPELHPGSADANSTRLGRVSLPRAFPVERLIALALYPAIFPPHSRLFRSLLHGVARKTVVPVTPAIRSGYLL